MAENHPLIFFARLRTKGAKDDVSLNAPMSFLPDQTLRYSQEAIGGSYWLSAEVIVLKKRNILELKSVSDRLCYQRLFQNSGEKV